MRANRKKSTFLRTTEDSNSLVERVVYETCQAIDSPRSLAVWLLFRGNEHQQLLGLEIDPSSYASADRFADDYLVSKLLSKYPSLNTGIDTEAVAKATFLSCEKSCAETNSRLARDPFGAFGSIMDSVRKIISSCLPVCEVGPKLPLGEILPLCGWGPGVTSSVKGRFTSRFKKLSGRLDLTKNLYDVGGLALVNASPAWKKFHSMPPPLPGNPGVETDLGGVNYRLTGGNTLTFVPKNAKTDRPIAVEPHLNAYLQKGIGTYIRRRLFRCFGLDLLDQGPNSELARIGSVTDNVATIDLKSASDTISQEVVEFLIPPEWLVLLGSCRSQKYLDDGKWHHYHKWSSMGNGYTFELETLIFYSVAVACTRSLGADETLVRVYGDDVALPTEVVELYTSVIRHLGFAINQEKSFSRGPFRESCGKDYFLGVDVRPFFIREPLEHLSSVFKLANAVQRYAQKRQSFGRDVRFKKVWMVLFLAVQKNQRFRIPDGIGDSGFIGSFDECSPARSRRRSVLYQRSWYKFPTLAFKAKEERKDGPLAVPSVLGDYGELPEKEAYVSLREYAMSFSANSIDGSLHQASKAGRWKLAVGFSPDWPDLGPWISRG